MLLACCSFRPVWHILDTRNSLSRRVMSRVPGVALAVGEALPPLPPPQYTLKPARQTTSAAPDASDHSASTLRAVHWAARSRLAQIFITATGALRWWDSRDEQNCTINFDYRNPRGCMHPRHLPNSLRRPIGFRTVVTNSVMWSGVIPQRSYIQGLEQFS